MSWPSAVIRTVHLRSGGICERCQSAPATEMHHRKYKSRGGKDTVENAAHLCGWGNHTGCHGWAHTASDPQGWSVHSWEDPGATPLLFGDGWWVLLGDGTREREQAF